MSKKLSERIFDYYKLNDASPTMFSVDGTRVKKDKFFEKFILGEEELALSHAEIAQYTTRKHQFVSRLTEALEKRIHSRDKAQRVVSTQGMYPTTLEEDEIELGNLMPFINFAKSDQRFIYNTVTREVSDLDFENWLRMHPPSEREALVANVRIARIVYNPYSMEPYWSEMVKGVGKVAHVNTHSTPLWRDVKIDNPECPDDIKEFLVHLFPIKKDRDYVIYWLRASIIDRNETYLVLNGAKGLGKNVLVESILMPLVGESNFKVAPESLLNGNFNAVLRNSRAIFMDEVKMDSKEQRQKLKRYINTNQTIENKGKDADKTEETFASFVIANNDIGDVNIEYDDRRFSVPTLTAVPLKKIWSTSKINSFANKYKDEDGAIAQFGHWLLNTDIGTEYDRNSVLTSDHFYKLVYESLKEWQKVVCEVIFSKDKSEYTIVDFKKKYGEIYGREEKSKFRAGHKRLADFLKNYRHDGEDLLGTVEKRGTLVVVIPSSAFNPEAIEGDDVEDML